MAMLDFIKEHLKRRQQQSAPAQPKQENAKQAYTRRDAEEHASQPSVSQLDARGKAGIQSIRDSLQAFGERQGSAPALNMKTVDEASSPQPMRQNMMRQESGAPALTPTSAQMGQPAQAKAAPASKAPAPQPQKPQPPKAPQPTVRRRPPSWQR